MRYHYYPGKSQAGDSNAGQLRAITKESWLGFTQETLIGEIDQDARDSLTRHSNHNGRVTEKRFHPDGTLSSIAVSDGMQLAYNFDEYGQIRSIDRDGTLSNYEYLNGRLSRAATSQGDYHYQYDRLGNRTQRSVLNGFGKRIQSRYAYTDKGHGNRLMKINDAGYQYDATGLPTRTQRLRYVYNTEQRPVKIYEGETLLAEYHYNSFGERIKKVVNTDDDKQVTYFLYDSHQLTAAVSTTTSSKTDLHYRQTVYLGHAPTVYLDGKATYSIHSDHLGTPLSVSNSDRDTVWAASHSPFGEAVITTEHIRFDHRLPGQYFDSETGTQTSIKS